MLYWVKVLNARGFSQNFFWRSSDQREAAQSAAGMFPIGNLLIFKENQPNPFGSAKDGVVLTDGTSVPT